MPLTEALNTLLCFKKKTTVLFDSDETLELLEGKGLVARNPDPLVGGWILTSYGRGISRMVVQAGQDAMLNKLKGYL